MIWCPAGAGSEEQPRPWEPLEVPETSTFPRALRVTRKSEYERIFGAGVRVRGACLKLVVARRDERGAPSRLGTAVSRKMGGAARRNRTRRRLREAFRAERSAMPTGLDIVCIPLTSVTEASWAELRATLRELAALAVVRLDRRDERRLRRKEAEAPGGGEPGAPEGADGVTGEAQPRGDASA
jgi:ribonuclease P protein component